MDTTEGNHGACGRRYTKLAALCGFMPAFSDGDTEEIEWYGDSDVRAHSLTL